MAREVHTMKKLSLIAATSVVGAATVAYERWLTWLRTSLGTDP